MVYKSLSKLTLDFSHNMLQSLVVFSKFNDMDSLQEIEIHLSTKIGCGLANNYISSTTDSVTCAKCYQLCGRCLGPAENQCKTCLDPSKLKLNEETHTCDFIMPDVKDEVLTLDFSLTNMNQAILATLMEQIKSHYTDVSNIKHLKVNLSDNYLTDFESLEFFASFKELEEVHLDLSR